MMPTSVITISGASSDNKVGNMMTSMIFHYIDTEQSVIQL